MPGGSSLAKLLEAGRGVRNKNAPPPLDPQQILGWADTYHKRVGEWPRRGSDEIGVASGETWAGIDNALNRGLRGLPEGSSLAQLLEAERGIRNHANLPQLTEGLILEWADLYHERTGGWPKSKTGKIAEAPFENWRKLDNALRLGLRGLPGGSSLAKLLAAKGK